MTSKRNGRATLADVAAAAGVSKSTASRAFSRPELIRPENVERIRRIAAELGYTADPRARALSTGRTANIAVIVPDIANPFFPPLVRAVESGAERAELAVFLGDTDESASRERVLVDRLEKQVDGFVLASPRLPDAQIRELAERVPTVLINRDIPGVHRVLVDAATGVREAVELLIALGHRAIAYLAGPPESWADQQRRDAVVQAAAHAGLALSVLELGRPSYEAGRECVGSMIATGATAAIAFDDVIAHGVLAGFATLGREVPADFSVIGCDDVLAATTFPALTTISGGSAASGAAALDTLLALIDGEHPEQRTAIAGHLVHRASVSAVRQHAR
ncbi:LacI family transcriptional regulator [Microbacterium keratanolyticum]|uniref:LacI family transcriptional regulator n=1 Tax=Microbacterium keratanolyticum TaxID=67574 RepID=A0A9W6M838_9MICO|nr:LacI family DNA-binding transcriptional regulator [Microbacterium keratanolyticum]MBM7469023.1 LacI family transcriptional regulator [Microbacterium keratanolyticum]GLK01102.1 LacI family transcriptional regulator [Microbacterium keratanolyticum]